MKISKKNIITICIGLVVAIIYDMNDWEFWASIVIAAIFLAKYD